MSLPFSFHHLGLAVRSTERISRFLRAQGYDIGDLIHDPLQNVHLAMCRSDSAPDIELITPAEGPSPIDAVLKRVDTGIYHLCYEVEGREAVEAVFAEHGLKAMPVSPPKPAVLFGGRHVAFYNIIGVGVTEFLFAR